MNGERYPFKNKPCTILCSLDAFDGIVVSETFSCAAARAFDMFGDKNQMVMDIHDEAKEKEL